MRITESQLRRIIRQEVRALREGANDAQIIRDTLAKAGYDTSDADLYELTSDGQYIVGPSGKISVDAGEVESGGDDGYRSTMGRQGGYGDYGGRSYGGGYGGGYRSRRRY